MIVIEPVGIQERPRYPGGVQLPVIIPPSPEGSAIPLPPERRSSFWSFGLLAALVAAIAYGSESPVARLGYSVTPRERKRGQKLLYLWKYYRPREKPTTVSSGNVDYFKERSGKEGDLYPVFAYTADHAREMISQGKVKPYRPEEEPAPAKPAPKRPRERPTEEPADSQLTLFGNRLLSGRIANCAIWIPDESGGWKCGLYGRVCDPPTCGTPPDPKIKQVKVCVKNQHVFSAFYDREIIRCKQYETACEGAACMPEPMPYPTAEAERKPTKEETRRIAEWMAEEYNEQTFGKEPYFAREILSRGGIRSYRKGREKEEYKAIPLFMKNAAGLPADEMAAEMGFDTDRDLFEAIFRAYPKKAKGAYKKLRRRTWEEFREAAHEMIEEGIEEGTWSDLLYLSNRRSQGLLGQELFPGLRREMVLEPPEDVATSDDPVTACMERLGWRTGRMEELKRSIAEKRTPDLFTGKTKRLSAGEKEYQRVMSECLAARSGTAGLGARRGVRKKRISWNKGDINSAINAARKLVYDKPLFIFATYYGYEIEPSVPFSQNHYKVHEDGTVEFHARDLRTGEWTVRQIRALQPDRETRLPEQLRLLGRQAIL